MSYIGRGTDKISNVEKLDNISFSGSTATFNLTKGGTAFIPSSAECIRLAIDGVEQGNNYTVSGSQITFDFTPSGSSTNNWIYHIGVGVITTPGDGTVTLDKLSATGTKNGTTFLAGDNTFKTVSGTTINNNADNRVITGSGSANTLEGEVNLTFDGGTLTVKDDANGSTTETLVVTNGTSANPSYSNLVFKTPGNTTGCFIKGVQASSGNDGRLEFHVNNSGTSTEAMRMNYLGRVYIGETSSSGYNGAVWKDADGISLYRPTSTGGNGVLLFYSDANSTKGNVGYYTANGGLANYQSNNVNLSDERLKKDIVDCPSTWDKIKNLQVRNFKYKNDTDEKVVTGLIAQEVETVDASLVNSTNGLYGYEKEQKEGKFKQIYTTDLYHQMLKALQEAQTKIETLEAKVQALEENNGSN